jgi:hypothetical protein
MLDGKRLIELPSKTVDLLKLEFSEEERAVYKMVSTASANLTPNRCPCFCSQIEARSQATFNRFLRAGTVLKNYHQGP